MSAAAARVIGIGRDGAGDDGVGPMVLSALRERGAPPGVELHVVGDPTLLIALLDTDAAVILVDAVVGASPGSVLDLRPEDLEQQGLTPLSTHGLGVMQAIALARALDPAAVSRRIHLVGVGIAPPGAPCLLALSPPVAAAVPLAVRAILRILEDPRHA